MKIKMLHLFIGPMFSGKTTTLISRLERYKIGGKRCIVVKYDKDVRYDDQKICSHSQVKHEAIKTNLLEKVHAEVIEYDVIMIDEIQFFKDASVLCSHWANKNIIVEVYGLNGDFQQKPFEQISLLIPQADKISHLTAIDRANGFDAPFTIRITDEKEQEIIGGQDIYKAVSRKTLSNSA